MLAGLLLAPVSAAGRGDAGAASKMARPGARKEVWLRGRFRAVMCLLAEPGLNPVSLFLQPRRAVVLPPLADGSVDGAREHAQTGLAGLAGRSVFGAEAKLLLDAGCWMDAGARGQAAAANQLPLDTGAAQSFTQLYTYSTFSLHRLMRLTASLLLSKASTPHAPPGNSHARLASLLPLVDEGRRALFPPCEQTS